MQVEAIEKARDVITIRQVYGEPFERDGLTVIPAARVGGGAGGGAAEGVEGGAGASQGGGFGVHARPVGAFVIKDGNVRWQPAIDATRIALGGQVVAVVALLTIRRLLKLRAKRR